MRILEEGIFVNILQHGTNSLDPMLFTLYTIVSLRPAGDCGRDLPSLE